MMAKFSKVHFQHATDNWSTPKDFYDALDKKYHFDYDPCPLNSNYEALGIFENWGFMNFVNPPYSNIGQFMQTAINALKYGKQSIFLVPARTDTKWFHDLVLPNAARIEFIRGRLRFGNSKNSAPFPSMIVYFMFKQVTTL